MKEQLEKLQTLGLDVNDFYTIAIWERELRLQGHVTKELLNKLKELDFEIKFEKDSNFIIAEKDNVTCNLTF
jgi:hypothetical protein